MLLPWPSPSMIPMPSPMLPMELYDGVPSTPEPYWDQFDENQRLFGVTTTYDPSMSAYTTPLAVDSLTEEQIAKAEMLSRIPLPSEKLRSAATTSSCCVFCEKCFDDLTQMISHFRELIFLVLLSEGSAECSGTAQMKALLKRKSWIVSQEALPNGLVSQIESLYKRQISSSTNLQMIIDSVRSSDSISEDTREYLITELICLIIDLAGEAKSKLLPEQKPTKAFHKHSKKTTGVTTASQ